MTPGRALLVALAGVIAGVANTVAGGGSLLTFPVLLSLGLSPLAANVSNTVGLVVGAYGGIGGYSKEVHSQLWRLPFLVPAVVLGALVGTALLLLLPSSVFTDTVPVLILLACVLLLAQPRLVRLTDSGNRADNPWPLRLLLLPVSAYGAYFGAGLGIMTLALTGVFLKETLPRLNALKLVFAATTNTIAAVIFALRAPVDWLDALLLAVGSTVGAVAISPVAKRIPATPLRLTIAVIGIGVAIRLALTH